MSEEEREFQIAMLETQISCEGNDTLYSLMTAIGYSVSISFYAISFTIAPQPLTLELLTISTIILAMGILSSVKLLLFHQRSVPQKMQDLRKRFVKPQTQPKESATSNDAEKKTVLRKPNTTTSNVKK